MLKIQGVAHAFTTYQEGALPFSRSVREGGVIRGQTERSLLTSLKWLVPPALYDPRSRKDRLERATRLRHRARWD